MQYEKVQKMKEGEIVSEESLRKEWLDVLSRFELLINGGHKLRPIRFIIRHIIDKGYDKVLFPGTSMYSLLISLPVDSKVNYDKTLKIEYNSLDETLKFRYSDWIGTDRRNADLRKRVQWEETCQATEGAALHSSGTGANNPYKSCQQSLILFFNLVCRGALYAYVIVHFPYLIKINF